MANSKATSNAQSVTRLDNLKTINGVDLYGPGNLVISGTFVDAPSDGNIYGRQNAGWVVIPASSGATNLSYTAAIDGGIIVSDTGTDATIPAGSTVNASLMLPADKTKLNGIASGAQLASVVAGANVTINNADPQNPIISAAGGGGATNLAYTASATDGTITSDTGTDATIPAGSATDASLMLPADKTKLDGVASGATANSADAFLLNRVNHTGTQSAATITGLATVATSGVYTDLSGTPNLAIYATKNTAARVITGEDTPTSADLNKKIRSNAASAHNITISDALNTAAAVDDVILIQWRGAGVPSFVVSGNQTINDATAAIPMTQRYQLAVLEKVADNTWVLSGAV